jgi:hypothetical protein
MMNLIGLRNKLLKVLAAAIHMLLSALFAYCMTDLSTTTLVGDTKKPVTIPERASAMSILVFDYFLLPYIIVLNLKLKEKFE